MDGPVIAGVDLATQGAHLFQCPECGHRVRNDDRYEPACTGPHPSRDDHPMMVMEYVGTTEARAIWTPK